MNVGFNRNSGGWTGVYSQNNNHFEGPLDVWSGPTFDFAIRAAEMGQFQLNITAPLSVLKNKTIEAFSTSPFDHCVYSTALGYNDFCVSQYTVTDQRALTSEWFVLDEVVSPSVHYSVFHSPVTD